MGYPRLNIQYPTGLAMLFRWPMRSRSLASPLDIRAHSTRGLASSTALFRGVPLEDICMAAGWSSPHTFVKFYNLM